MANCLAGANVWKCIRRFGMGLVGSSNGDANHAQFIHAVHFSNRSIHVPEVIHQWASAGYRTPAIIGHVVVVATAERDRQILIQRKRSS